MGITDQLLMAYVDGELSPDLAALILSRLEDEPDLLDRMEQQQDLRLELSAAYGGVLAEPLPPGLAALMTQEAAAVRRRTERSAATPFARLRDAWPIGAAAAAAGVIGIGLSEARHSGDPFTRSGDGRILASGALAQSLESNLAVESKAPGAKIMASFQDRLGRYCRVFQGSGREDGVACKSGERWEVVALATSGATPSEGYRQASSGLAPSLAAAVEELQDAGVMTADQERLARTRQWQGKAGGKSS